MSVARRSGSRLALDITSKSFRLGNANGTPWICLACRTSQAVGRRPFSSTRRVRDDEVKKQDITRELPSVSASRRSHFQQRMSRILDELLVKASETSRHINAYTGTDYSGIENLRERIAQHEEGMRSFHEALAAAKRAVHDAQITQSSAKNDVVALLERKSSWTPADLERYMSLVRSEHLNEQEVATAKENEARAEQELEDARSRLERLRAERDHEERIWSDTIRRNSTWVTIALMGANILLLLFNIGVFEPLRQNKIFRKVEAREKLLVEEFKAELKTLLGSGAANVSSAASPANAASEQSNTAEPTKEILDELLPPSSNRSEVVETPQAVGAMLPPEASDFAGAVPRANTLSEVVPEPVRSTAEEKAAKGTWESYEEYLRDLWSERTVQMRKVDVTNTALQGAATGVAVMGLLFICFRPH